MRSIIRVIIYDAAYAVMVN